MGSLNPAEAFQLNDQGAVAPGYEANFILLDDLETFSINSVYYKGEKVVENGALIEQNDKMRNDVNETAVRHSVNLPELTPASLSLPLPHPETDIIGIIPNQIVTRHLVEITNVKDGCFQPDRAKDHQKMAVIERHRASGSIGLGVVKGFHFKKGAIATTIAHDSHNVVCTGTNDEDMLCAVEAIKQSNGGMAVAKDGKIIAALPLPIAGLMTNLSGTALNEQLNEIENALKEIGFHDNFNPFLTLSFLALPVIPELKLTDQGLFDVNRFSFL